MEGPAASVVQLSDYLENGFGKAELFPLGITPEWYILSVSHFHIILYIIKS